MKDEKFGRKEQETDREETQKMGILIEKQIRIPTFFMSGGHTHTFYEFFYLKRGACSYVAEGKVYQLAPGEMLVIPPGCRHRTRYEGAQTCERIALFFEAEEVVTQFRTLQLFFEEKFHSVVKITFNREGQQQVLGVFEHLQREMTVSDYDTRDIARLCLLQLFYYCKRYGSLTEDGSAYVAHANQDIETALAFIREHYAQPLTLEELAGRVSLSPSYFSRKFKRVTGANFSEYLNFIRIKRACYLLVTTGDPITRIALACGFNSSNYFKDCFRRIYGVSPREYRNRRKGTRTESDREEIVPEQEETALNQWLENKEKENE